MILKPVKLGKEALEREEMLRDRKSCKRFGPCGVGEKALYLSSFYFQCRYYLPYKGILRVYKRVAMSKGGFSRKGVFASIPYLVVVYDNGVEKQCTYKIEEQVDQLLSYLKEIRPEIKQMSPQGEMRAAERERNRKRKPKPELTAEAVALLHTLREAEAVLEERPELYRELSEAARQKRQVLLIIGERRGSKVKKREEAVFTRADRAKEEMERFLSGREAFPVPARYAHPVVLRRMERIVKEGGAADAAQALHLVKEALKALNSDVEVSREEYDEVVVVKAMFLNEEYR